MRLTEEFIDAVLKFIRREFVESDYLLRRTDVMFHFDIPESVANKVLRELQDSGRVIWDHMGLIRPAFKELVR